MGDEKSKGVEGNAHKLVLGGRAVAAVSLLLLVPFVRHMRERHRERQHHHRRFLIFGH
jgi:hypothetical protein